MEVDPGEVTDGSTEVVKTQLDNREDRFKILKPPILLRIENSLVSVKESVVVDPNYGDVFWQ